MSTTNGPAETRSAVPLSPLTLDEVMARLSCSRRLLAVEARICAENGEISSYAAERILELGHELLELGRALRTRLRTPS